MKLRLGRYIKEGEVGLSRKINKTKKPCKTWLKVVQISVKLIYGTAHLTHAQHQQILLHFQVAHLNECRDLN